MECQAARRLCCVLLRGSFYGNFLQWEWRCPILVQQELWSLPVVVVLVIFSPFIKRKVSQDLLSIDILCRANWQYVEAALDTRAKREELQFSSPTHSVLRQ